MNKVIKTTLKNTLIQMGVFLGMSIMLTALAYTVVNDMIIGIPLFGLILFGFLFYINYEETKYTVEEDNEQK